MQKYTDFTELPIIYRGDDEATMVPYGGVAVLRDGRFILASRYRGRLAMVGADGMVISTCDPLNGHIKYDKLICYGIALHTSERSLYMLVGEEGSNELYVSTIEVVPSQPEKIGIQQDIWHGTETEVVEYRDPVFHWVPSSDVRLPSVPARSSNYQDYENISDLLVGSFRDYYSYPMLCGFTKDIGPSGEDVLTPAGPFEWDIEKRKPKDVPENFCWDDTAYWDWQPFSISSWTDLFGAELNIPSLGPIIVDYPVIRPQIISIGSRVMVSCMNAQLLYSTGIIGIQYQKIEGSLLGDVEDGELRQTFLEWLLDVLKKEGLIEDDITVEGIDSGEQTLDVFQEGFWWWVDEDSQMIHFRVSFHEGRPVSSIVTLHPDLGTVDGLFHLSMYYPIAHMFSEQADITIFNRDTAKIFYNAFDAGGQGVFWFDNEFDTNYENNKNPTPIDIDFYLRLLEHFIAKYKLYMSLTVNPMDAAIYWKDMYKSKMTWEDPLFSQYATVDEALLSVYEPTFE